MGFHLFLFTEAIKLKFQIEKFDISVWWNEKVS